MRYSQTAVKAVCFRAYMQGHLNCDSWKIISQLHQHFRLNCYYHSQENKPVTKWKKSYKVPPSYFSIAMRTRPGCNSHMNMSEVHWGRNISAKFSHCVFFTESHPNPSVPCCLSSIHPQHSSFTFPASHFPAWASLCCKHPYYCVLCQHRSVPAPRLKPTSHLPRSALHLCPAVLWAALSLCPCWGDQSDCMLRQALMSSHSCWYPCIAPSASQHITSRELPYLVLVHIQLGFPQPALKYFRVHNQIFMVSTL